MANKTVVSIENLWYGDVLTSGTLTAAAVKALLAASTTKPIPNVHGDTWAYEEAEASTTDYINQLNGKVYYRDSVSGAVSMTFSIGQYDYQTKADLQGGTATEKSWTRPETSSLIYKSLVAKTKDGTYIVFPRAAIAARGGMVEKAIGVLLSGVAMDTGVEGLASEGWFDASEVEAA